MGISLTPFDGLGYAPFGLLGELESSADAVGIWRCADLAAVLNLGKIDQVHWYDGAFLASFLVSSSNFIDPVNRRPLTHGECLSLDEYLYELGLPAVEVADAFQLHQHVSSKAGGRSEDRVTALEREAANVLRSLFDFRSAGNLNGSAER